MRWNIVKRWASEIITQIGANAETRKNYEQVAAVILAFLVNVTDGDAIYFPLLLSLSLSLSCSYKSPWSLAWTLSTDKHEKRQSRENRSAFQNF